MAFVMGWSGLVYASVQTTAIQHSHHIAHSIHHDTSVGQALSSSQKMAEQSDASRSHRMPDCHQQHQNIQQVAQSDQENQRVLHHQDCNHDLTHVQMTSMGQSATHTQNAHTSPSTDHGHTKQHLSDHHHCDDCSPTHCQTVKVNELNPPVLSLKLNIGYRNSEPLNTDVHVQHLVGFWQQILRPPKA